MHQLSGMDASFIYLETDNSPMHISSLAIYDQSSSREGKVRFKDIIDNVSRRVHVLPPMTRCLKKVPFNLDHPYWISQGQFDTEFHVRHIALPRPGDWRQLCILISRIHARPLDRARPLWEVYVIEGLDNVEGAPTGSFAIFSKTHHAAVDGSSGVEMVSLIHDLTNDWKDNIPDARLEIDSIPTPWELFRRTGRNYLQKPGRFISVARNTVPSFAKTLKALRKGELERVKGIPRTRFNRNISPHRVFQAITVDLAAVKVIRRAVDGATVNDVALTIVGGAMRKYLLHHNELPEQSMVAHTPVNIRDESDENGGNIVSGMMVLLRSDIKNPLERLNLVKESTKNAKNLTKAIGARAMVEYSQFIPGGLMGLGARVSSQYGLREKIAPLANCIITNVPGPAMPIYCTGARMVNYFGAGPAADGLALFHVVSSYCEHLTISATCCRDVMPDPDFYKACLEQSFEELDQAVSTLEADKVPSRLVSGELIVATKGKARR